MTDKQMTTGLRAHGMVLILASLTSTVTMMFHPSTTAHDFAGAVSQVAAMQGTAGWVHGLMIAGAVGMVFGYGGLARALRPSALAEAALTLYAAGTVFMLIAVLANGFVTPDLATAHLGESGRRLESLRAPIQLLGALNQASAKLGTVMYSGAIALWSLQLLLRRRSRGQVAAGLLGLALGGLTAAAVVGGGLRLDVHGMLAVVASQAAWGVAVGVFLARGTLAERP